MQLMFLKNPVTSVDFKRIETVITIKYTNIFGRQLHIHLGRPKGLSCAIFCYPFFQSHYAYNFFIGNNSKHLFGMLKNSLELKLLWLMQGFRRLLEQHKQRWATLVLQQTSTMTISILALGPRPLLRSLRAGILSVQY